MSAYIVNKEHIDAFVAAAQSLGSDNHSSGLSWYWGGQTNNISYYDQAGANLVGQMLWRENHTSVVTRYPDGKFSTEAVEGYTWGARDERGFRLAVAEFSPVEILKALDGYEYQTCEHSGWQTSEAFHFCQALRRKMIGCLPGYNEANTWSIG